MGSREQGTCPPAWVGGPEADDLGLSDPGKEFGRHPRSTEELRQAAVICIAFRDDGNGPRGGHTAGRVGWSREAAAR